MEFDNSMLLCRLWYDVNNHYAFDLFYVIPLSIYDFMYDSTTIAEATLL